ncbi:MAG: hypothetical protein H6Q15_92 [Bacteroidetes bacterium]|nr:hypothetical protein [Bacteroidota bacterium]
MNNKTKIVSIKSIKIGFDIVFILMSILAISFIAFSIFDISNLSSKSSLGTIFAEAKPIKAVTTDDFIVNSSIENVSIKSIVDSYHLTIMIKSDDFQMMPFAYRIFYLLALNLSMFFLLFILFHIRNILNSLVKGLNEKDSKLQHYIFDKKNIMRFRYIAYAFIVMPLIEVMIYFFDSFFLQKYINIEGYSIEPISQLALVSWDYIFIGLFFISLIEIIRRGIDIQEENDLTV